MKQHQLAALVAVVDSGSFHAAAATLHVSQPAISKALKDLEAELGVQLLVRHTRSVEPTREGEVLLARARLVVNELRRAQEDFAHLKGSRDGRLTIGVTPLAGLTILPKAFERFRSGWPEVKLEFIEFTSGQLNPHVRDRTLDLAVGAITQNDEVDALRSEELFSLPTAFSVHRSSPLAACRTLADLQEAEWIHADITERFPRFLAGLFAQQGLTPPRRVTRCTSQALFHSLAMQNDVVFFWSLLAIAMPELRTRFVALPVPLNLPRLSVRLLLHESGPLTRPAAHFVQCIRDVARDDWALAE